MNAKGSAGLQGIAFGCRKADMASVRSATSSLLPSSASAMDVSTLDDAFNGASVPIRIYVPELNVQKVIHFHRDELVWNVKQQCLATLPKVSGPCALGFSSVPVPAGRAPSFNHCAR